MGSGQADSVVHKSASFPSNRETCVCKIPTLPLKTKDGRTARMKTNIVKRSLIMARVDIAAEVGKIIKLKRTIFDPTINKTFVVAHTRFTRLNCDWHNQMRWIDFANMANDIDGTVADPIHYGSSNKLFKRMTSPRIWKTHPRRQVAAASLP